MTRDAKDVPLRFRVTRKEHERHVAAATRLGISEMSTFYRWALENSTTQVLGPVAPPPQPQRAQRAAPAPRAPPPPPPAPPPPPPALPQKLADAGPAYFEVSEPEAFVPQPSAPRGSPSELLGIPLTAPRTPVNVRPAPFEFDDEP